MSGHSKWSQIKHKKGISDQKKGQVFSKLAKRITVAAKNGADPSVNFKLQSAIDEARAANMPKDNIDRAIKRVSEKDSAALNEMVIQGMGPFSIAIIVEAITDNTNRTIGEIKNVFSKNDVKMVPENSLNWMFDANWNPHSPLEISDESVKQKIDKLFEELNSHDDVGNVHTNLKQ
ncbi:MAG: YebC/PmpR family DNA-binding transcriptional regulator [Candidatus Paceibacterota bacterium]